MQYNFNKLVATAIISSFITSLIFIYIAPNFLWGKIIPIPSPPESNLKKEIIIPKREPPTVAEVVAKKATPAVVGITTLEFERKYYFLERAVEGVGSGFIVHPDGYIITNNHVANENSRNIKVYLSNGNILPGKVMWTDPVLDLTILKVDAKNLPMIELGDSDRLSVGQTAIAIGNPLGLRFQRTVTLGIISALNRSLPITEDSRPKIMEDLIQTDASINPGNSGGPLMDSQGYAIGINTAKVTTAEGLGFAIPINIVKPILKKVIETGTFKPPYLGIVAYDREIASYITADVYIYEGIYVADIDPTGPAYKAGIRKGYIILEVDGKPVNTMTSLKCIVYEKKPGESIKVKYKTLTGKEGYVTIVLGK